MNHINPRPVVLLREITDLLLTVRDECRNGRTAIPADRRVVAFYSLMPAGWTRSHGRVSKPRVYRAGCIQSPRRVSPETHR